MASSQFLVMDTDGIGTGSGLCSVKAHSELIQSTRPWYQLMGGLHGPPINWLILQYKTNSRRDCPMEADRRDLQ